MRSRRFGGFWIGHRLPYETNGNRTHDRLVVSVIDIETTWVLDLGHDTLLCCRIFRRDIHRMNGARDSTSTPGDVPGRRVWMRDAAPVSSGEVLL